MVRHPRAARVFNLFFGENVKHLFGPKLRRCGTRPSKRNGYIDNRWLMITRHLCGHKDAFSQALWFHGPFWVLGPVVVVATNWLILTLLTGSVVLELIMTEGNHEP